MKLTGKRYGTESSLEDAPYTKLFDGRCMSSSSTIVMRRFFQKKINSAMKPFCNQNLIIIVPVIFFVIFFTWSWQRAGFSMVFECKQKDIMLTTADRLPNDSPISVHNKEKDLLVLVWVWPFGEPFPLNTCLSVYGISGCKLTADRSLYNMADAVVMHHVDIMYEKNLPWDPRPHHQRWVWFNMEPPLIIKNLHFLNNMFNMTMTFRQDSDVYRPYGRIEALREPQSFTIPAKSKLVAWVVSKWYPGVRRNEYYEELKKYIPIDVYGKNHMELSWDDFYTTISQYKFYLAFENSIYKDYITEKLWSNAFDSWAVPVVLGTTRKNYERFLPGEAFIHVDDFPSAKDLADYLFQLDNDDERYKNYFNWRSLYRVRRETGWDNHYCKACRALRQAPDYQIIPSLEKWFLEGTNVYEK
ncbi:3-galactosyl-N-acetylglucosaminide 4-alpha-L-fucosyltransferase FUT3-like [Rana temporaria]|uniref:3-galactosyl-N-acetylglucosaminide 4-alpha-L-fucosyltransferase FUT3-like n=1 Tax=Rana temporaria TaxID=8407 RepID=UPI001AADE10F|nr:3-galactosyl-N-acetylglucosaminide 4-alpha-L-fucosyltransferase FUT3-like [Rana temporaria]